MHDLSPGDMLIQTSADLATFDDLEVELPETGITQAVVVWSSGAFFGSEFREPLSGILL